MIGRYLLTVQFLGMLERLHGLPSTRRMLTFYDGPHVSWNYAVETCRERSKNVLSVDTEDIVTALELARFAENFWTGLHDINNDPALENYVWSASCEPLGSYAPWASTDKLDVERCIRGKKSLNPAALWETRDCSSNDGVVVCESHIGDCLFEERQLDIDLTATSSFIEVIIDIDANECQTTCLQYVSPPSQTECWGYKYYARCTMYVGKTYTELMGLSSDNGGTSILYLKNCLEVESQIFSPGDSKYVEDMDKIPWKGCPAFTSTTETATTTTTYELTAIEESTTQENPTSKVTTEATAGPTTFITPTTLIDKMAAELKTIKAIQIETTTRVIEPSPRDGTTSKHKQSKATTTKSAAEEPTTLERPTITKETTMAPEPTRTGATTMTEATIAAGEPTTIGRPEPTTSGATTAAEEPTTLERPKITKETTMAPEPTRTGATTITEATRAAEEPTTIGRPEPTTSGATTSAEEPRSTKKQTTMEPKTAKDARTIEIGTMKRTSTLPSTTTPGDKSTKPDILTETETTRVNPTQSTPEFELSTLSDLTERSSTSYEATEVTTLKGTSTETSTCVCNCVALSNLTDTQKAGFIRNIIRNLTIDTRATSSTRRKYTSASDPRPSAKYVGSVGVALLFLSLVGLFVLDIHALANDLRKLLETFKKLCT